jgi:hypothetical protein
VSAFGTFSLADIATQAQNGQLRSMQIDALRRKQETDAEEAERTAMREQAGMIAKLTDGVQDEASYQQRRQAALAYGMDPSAIPETYDPQFVQTYNVLAHTLLKPDGEAKLTTTAQELRDAGYQPGTPEFITAMRQRLDMRDSKVISAQAGGQAGLYGPGGYKPIIAPNDGSAPAGSPVGGGVQEGATATNPQTGEKLIFRGGQWQPMGGGAGNSVGGFQP